MKILLQDIFIAGDITIIHPTILIPYKEPSSSQSSIPQYKKLGAIEKNFKYLVHIECNPAAINQCAVLVYLCQRRHLMS